MSIVDRRWLTVREAGEVYGLHPKTVFLLCAHHKIPHTRIPSARGGRGQVRVDRVGFDKLLEERGIPAIEKPLDQRMKEDGHGLAKEEKRSRVLFHRNPRKI